MGEIECEHVSNIANFQKILAESWTYTPWNHPLLILKVHIRRNPRNAPHGAMAYAFEIYNVSGTTNQSHGT